MTVIIDITIILNNQEYDFRISKKLTVEQLIRKVYQWQELDIPNSILFRIRVINKCFVAFDNQQLNSLAISNGDIVEFF